MLERGVNPCIGTIALFVSPFVLGKFVSKNKKDEDLDFVFSAAAVAAKANKTAKLLEFIAKQDSSMANDSLVAAAKHTFLQLQECWQSRNYDPMQSLLMHDLYVQHSAQIKGLVRNHEINMLDSINIQRIEIVNVRYTDKINEREFTALITATIRDYYLDDRTHAFLRGDESPAQFQEFWTFHRQDTVWLLREIEQSRESDKLREENFAEMFTDQQLGGIYGEAAGSGGEAGPWLEKEVETKATKIERMLNFLVQTDKLWNKKLMTDRARQIFADVLLAQEAGDPAAVNADELFPELAESLREEIRTRRGAGLTLEYRNLCVRKVELVLVRNLANRSDDEFVARISAHAQRAVVHNGQVRQQDEYVTPFEEFWTFGRSGHQWNLKEVVPTDRGKEAIDRENIDEYSSPSQLQWYYKHTRAN